MSYINDIEGRVEATHGPKGSIQYGYYDTGRKLYVRTPDTDNWSEVDTQVSFVYDGLGRLQFKEYYGAGAAEPNEMVEYAYDSLGRKTGQTLYNTEGGEFTAISWSDYEYDFEGNIVKVDTSEGAVNYSYHDITQRKSSTWTDNSETQYSYDRLGRLKNAEVTKRDGQTLAKPEITKYNYNEAGSRAAVEVGNGALAEYTYDKLNRLTDLTHYKTTAKINSLSTFSYGLYDNGMRSAVDESLNENHYIDYSYDNLNRLTEESNYDDPCTASAYGYTADYIYDLVGNRWQRVVEVKNSSGTHTLTTDYEYDPDADRLMTETTEYSGPSARIPWGDGYVYAYASNVSKIKYKLPSRDGRVGQLAAFFIGLPSVWSKWLLWTALILVPVVFFGPVVARKLSFPHRVRARHKLQRESRNPGSRIKSGMTTFRVKPGMTEGAPLRLRLWQRCLCVFLAYVMVLTPYVLESLAQGAVTFDQLDTTTWGQGNTTIEYSYDDNGSVIEKRTYTTGGDPADYDELVTYEYNLQNRLSKVTTAQPDGEDIIAEVTEYTYNPHGIRVEKHTWTQINSVSQNDDVTITYLIDSYNHTGYAQVLEETTDDGTNLTRIQYTLGDDIISQTKSTWTGSQWQTSDTQYLLYDGHGNTRQLINHTLDSGNVVITDNYSYDAYGIMLGGNPTPANPAATNFLYTGEQFDTSIDQYYLRARYYNQTTGRFNRTDPFAGSPQDPQSLHKYLYTHANPVNGIDPSGEFTLPELTTVIAITAIMVNIGVTVYNGVRNNLSAKAIAWQVVQNIAAFIAIVGVFACSGLIAVAAGATLALASIVGMVNLVRSWPKMDTTDRIVAGVTILTFLAFAGAVRAGTVPKLPPRGSFRPGSCSELPESYYSRTVVDMRNAPPGSLKNAAGFPTNAPWFWKKVLARHPEYFSPKNVQKISASNPKSPTIDYQWIKHHPTHASFMNSKLIHHHIGQGAYSVAIPEPIHYSWRAVLHPNRGKH